MWEGLHCSAGFNRHMLPIMGGFHVLAYDAWRGILTASDRISAWPNVGITCTDAGTVCTHTTFQPIRLTLVGGKLCWNAELQAGTVLFWASACLGALADLGMQIAGRLLKLASAWREVSCLHAPCQLACLQPEWACQQCCCCNTHYILRQVMMF